MSQYKEKFDQCYVQFKHDWERNAARMKVRLIYQEMQKRKQVLLKELKEIEKAEAEEQKRFGEVFMDAL